MLDDLRTLFRRDLDGVRAEVELYPDDVSLWQQVPGCPNSGGTLVLHLVGNLRHFVGDQLGGSGYVRQRDAEFSTRDLSRRQLLDLVATARAEVDAALASLSADRLDEPTPLPAGGRSVPLRRWLLHLGGHLAFHLGQLDYHRRTVTGDPTSAGGISIHGLVD